jgi:hypothetical protein
VLHLLAVVVQRRSAAAWKAIELIREGLSLAEAAERLGISRQAVGQRLATGLWHQEQAARPVAAALLARADTDPCRLAQRRASAGRSVLGPAASGAGRTRRGTG